MSDTCIVVIDTATGVTKRDGDVRYIRACDENPPSWTTTTVGAGVPPLPPTGASPAILPALGFALIGAALMGLVRRRG